MKIDIDSILYIVITVVILVITGLNGRRKKRTQMMESQANASRDEDSDPEEDYKSQEPQKVAPTIFDSFFSPGTTKTQSSNPFDRLEQILGTEGPQTNSMEGESLEEESTEGVSLETIPDEEEQILEDIRQRQEEEPSMESETDLTSPAEKGPEGLLKLFGNVDDIKKAVIYSEILNRKY